MPTDDFASASRLEGVPSAFAATRDGIDSLLRDRGLRRSSPDTTAESLLRGAAATAALEGSTYDVEALRAGEGDAVTLAAVRLSTELLGLVPVWERAPLQALARLHALVAAGRVDAADLGRPVHPAGAQRLHALAQQVVRPTEAPGLVVAALVHAEVAAAGAFCSDNPIVARAAERLVLVARGVDPASVTVPESGHAQAQGAYESARSAYEGGGQVGRQQWLLYAAEAFARGAEATPLENNPRA
ncbi:Fic family protein [Solicola gregarius]|uniref:Oxidoreductase n=1 Tax=Solicola gregarius TaxID=2908642 RepID=A0AA46TEK3_9ACTN|nr:oxidoreductase [Solicola gregarius]UYM03362.1 oxidoreductase [Solicola gregarius]